MSEGQGSPAPRRHAALALACLVAVAAVVGAGFRGASYDDAFITYRYARTWEETGRLAFHPEERVLGTTAPGYALLLGFAGRATGVGIPALGTLAALASLLALAALLAASAPRGATPGGPVISGGTVFLFGALALTARANIELFGAEQFATTALGATAVWLGLGRRRPIAAGLAVALAMICRFDAALLAGLLGLAMWRRERRFPWRFGIAGLLPALAFAAWLWSAFGAVVPHTMRAKQSEQAIAAATAPAGAPWLGAYGSAQWRSLRRGLPAASCLALGLLAAAGVAVTARRLGRRGAGDGPSAKDPAGLAAGVLGAWWVGHEIVYRILGVPFAPWYSVPSFNGLLLLAALGAAATARRVAPRPGLARAVLAAALLLPILLPGLGFVRESFGRPPDPRFEAYASAGRLVRDRLRERAAAREDAPADLVAAVEIGVLAWHLPTETRILDLAGLVTPAALEARRRGALADFVAETRPGWIIDVALLRAAWLQPILDHPGIAPHYRPIAEFPDGRQPGLAVRVLERR